MKYCVNFFIVLSILSIDKLYIYRTDILVRSVLSTSQNQTSNTPTVRSRLVCVLFYFSCFFLTFLDLFAQYNSII